jgi:hypothetical protein
MAHPQHSMCRTLAARTIRVGVFLLLGSLAAGCSHTRNELPTPNPQTIPSQPRLDVEHDSSAPTSKEDRQDNIGFLNPKTNRDSENSPSSPILTAAPVPHDETPSGETHSADDSLSRVWGLAGLRGFASGEQVAPNGLEYTPIFSMEMHLNCWLWSQHGVYFFADSTFWAQKAAPGITNSSQGPFDFSKREFDLDAGAAWNYSGRWEARVFAYSFNNLNRGDSQSAPQGFNDGIALENRYYLDKTYDALGAPDFDLARATFVSVGYYPTKDMVDGGGNLFKPGAFCRAYLTYDLWGERCYLYADTTLIAQRPFTPKLLDLDAGVAFRPFGRANRWEFRIGTAEMFDLRSNDLETSVYGSIRLIF